MNNTNTPFYKDKTFYLTALGFTAFGYLVLPKVMEWYKNRNSNY